MVLAALALAATVDAQTRRTTMSVSVRVVRAPSPAVSSADVTAAEAAAAVAGPAATAGLRGAAAQSGEPITAPTAPTTRLEVTSLARPAITSGDEGEEAGAFVPMPGFRLVTINF
jgi:hypothetical protein